MAWELLWINGWFFRFTSPGETREPSKMRYGKWEVGSENRLREVPMAGLGPAKVTVPAAGPVPASRFTLSIERV